MAIWHLLDIFCVSLQPYSLEPYKSKVDKLTLLDEAILYHDGNAITAVRTSGKFNPSCIYSSAYV